MTAAGMRTEALLPHFFTMIFIALSLTADVAWLPGRDERNAMRAAFVASPC